MSKPRCAPTLVLALLLAACTIPKLHPYELDEAEIGAPGVQTVGLLPLNTLLALPPELDGATGRVTSLIRAHLEECGVQVVDFGLDEARSLWSEGVDPESEDVDVDEHVSAYIQRLRERRAFDVLIQPSLVYRDARIRSLGAHAEWDGVTREIQKSGYVNMDGSVYVEPEIRGKMPGVSLHLAVYQLDGTRVFESYGGLDLVHEVEFGTTYRQDLNNRIPVSVYEWRLKRKRLRDMDALREGVALAFTPWLDPLPSSAAAAPARSGRP